MSSLFKRLLLRTKRSPVKRSATTYIQARGWMLTTGRDPQWNGYYRSRFGSFKGRVENLSQPRFLIQHPPAEQRDCHWACFRDVGEGWYSVHFSPSPGDIDSGVFAIEGVINEAFSKRKAA